MNRFLITPSPDQYISYAVNYMLYSFGKQIAFIYDSNPEMDAYNNIIISSFDVIRFDVSGLMKVSEDNIENDIINFLENITYYGSSNTYIITTLTDKSLILFFKMYKTYIIDKVNVFNLPKPYTVICFDYYTFGMIDKTHTEGQYVITSQLVTESNIQEKIKSILTPDYIINGEEINYLLSLYILAILFPNSDLILQSYIFKQIYSIDVDSPFGYLKMDKTNVLSRPISICQKDKDGVVKFVSYTIKVTFDTQVWKTAYKEDRVLTCNWKESFSEKYQRSLIKIGLLISLSGSYSLQDIALYSTYLMAIDLCNIEYNGIRGLYINPITIDIESDITKVGPAISVLAKNDVSFMFGLSKYLFLISILQLDFFNYYLLLK